MIGFEVPENRALFIFKEFLEWLMMVSGNKTLLAINDYPDQSELFKKLWLPRKQHFEAIVKADPIKKVFLKGWLNRLNDFKYLEQ